MKTVRWAMLLSAVVAANAMAAPAGDVKAPAPVEMYSSSAQLDIARIVATDDVYDAYSFVRKGMTYQDSKGQVHVVKYTVAAPVHG